MPNVNIAATENTVSATSLEAEITRLRKQFGLSSISVQPSPAAPVQTVSAVPAVVAAPVIPAAAAEPKKTRKKTEPPAAPVEHTLQAQTVKAVRNEYREMVEWTHLLINKLRAVEGNKYKGVHTVFSGFNNGLGAKYNLDKESVWKLVDLMAERKDLVKLPAKRGFTVYVPSDAPQQQNRESGNDLLKRLGLA